MNALRRCLLLLCLSFSLLPLPGAAVPVEGLYSAEVPVEDTAEEARAAAIRRALAQVLVKLTGDPAVVRRQEAKRLLSRAQKLLLEFGYRQEAGEEGRQWLWARFDGPVMERALRDAGLPLWGRERPAVLVWLAREIGGQRELVAPGTEGWYPILQQRASSLGIPLVVPRVDGQDRSRLTAADILAGFEEPLRQASERYRSQVVAALGVVQVGPGLWEAQVRLQDGEYHEQSSVPADSPEVALEEAMDWMASQLAARYARVARHEYEGRVELLVRGLHDGRQYAEVLGYLQGLDGVSRVTPQRLENDSVTLLVLVRGGARALSSQIALGRVLEAEAGDGTLSRYRYAGAVP